MSNHAKLEDLTLENRCKYPKEAFVTIIGGQLKLSLYLLLAKEYLLDHGLQVHSGSLKIDLCTDYLGISETPGLAQQV